jgi:hypothetical protein
VSAKEAARQARDRARKASAEVYRLRCLLGQAMRDEQDALRAARVLEAKVDRG